MPDVAFVKLGGSVITDKTNENKVNSAVIEQLSDEISEAYQTSTSQLVIGHGAGSYGHPQAKRYHTAEGNIGDDSRLGAALVRRAVIELNGIIINHLTKHQLPAIALSPNSFLTSEQREVNTVFVDPFVMMLRQKLIPVVHGDVVMDRRRGWAILSGETILNNLASRAGKYGYHPRLIIEVGNTAGVYDASGQTIPEINEANFKQVKPALKEAEHADVTGGMMHKIEVALTMAKLGIPTLLISGEPGNLKTALKDQPVEGTFIK